MSSLGLAGKLVSNNKLDQHSASNASRPRPSCLGSGASSQPFSHWASQSTATLYPRMIAHPSPQYKYMTTGVNAERTHLERLEGRSTGSSATHPCRPHPETRYICSSATVPPSMLHFWYLGPCPVMPPTSASRLQPPSAVTGEANAWLLGCASVTLAARWHDKLWLSRSLSDVFQQPIHHAQKLAKRDQS